MQLFIILSVKENILGVVTAAKVSQPGMVPFPNPWSMWHVQGHVEDFLHQKVDAPASTGS